MDTQASGILAKGALGNVTLKSAAGRFLRDAERSYLRELGGNPSVMQRILVTRLSRVLWEIEKFEQHILPDENPANQEDARIYNLLLGRFGDLHVELFGWKGHKMIDAGIKLELRDQLDAIRRGISDAAA